jgi:4-amino-4-deoxy-L-arabinose transferase-like glycosyltransferase
VDAGEHGSMQRRNILFAVIALLTIVRLVGLHQSAVDLFVDEAQYWSWSRHLAFGYFSKPPLLAWIIYLSNAVCGSSEFCIRAPAPIFYLGTSVTVYFIGRTAFNECVALWGALLTAFGLAVAFSARIISTDVPLLFFWALALLAYLNLLSTASLKWACILGAAIGLGLLAKYAMIYFVLSMFLAAALVDDARRLLRSPQCWLALAIAGALIAPNIVWNLSNQFVTFRHTGDLIQGEGVGLHPLQAAEFLLAQFAVFGPVVFAVLLVALARPNSMLCQPIHRVMIAFVLPPLILVTMTSFFTHAYANWAAPSFIASVVLVSAILIERKAVRLLQFSVGLGIVTQTALLVGDTFATRIQLPFLANPNPYNRTLGWRAFAEAAGHIARDVGAKTIAADGRYEVAALIYYWRDRPVRIVAWPTTESESFDFSDPISDSEPEPILFVSPCPFSQRLDAFYRVVSTQRFEGAIGTGGVRIFYAVELRGKKNSIGPLLGCAVAGGARTALPLTAQVPGQTH